jgi:hypothetical protein
VVGEGACRSGKALPCRSKASGSCNEPQADYDLCMHIVRSSAEDCICSTPSMAPWRLGPDWCCGHEVGEALKRTKAPRHARTSKHRRIAPFFRTSNLHTSGQSLSPPPPRCRRDLGIPLPSYPLLEWSLLLFCVLASSILPLMSPLRGFDTDSVNMFHDCIISCTGDGVSSIAGYKELEST